MSTMVPSGGKISGYYTFEKPSSSGTYKLFIEMKVIEDIYVSDNWYYSGEIEFNLRGY